MDKNIEFATSVIEYITKEQLFDEYWQEVDKNIFYSKVICCLCTLNEMFADEVDDVVFASEVGQEPVRMEDSVYGELVITKNEESVIHVSLLAERSQTIITENS